MIINIKKYIYISILLISISLYSQAPQKFSYQAVIRNNSNTLIVSSPIGLRISLLQGSSIGNPVYVETQTTNTNSNGLISIAIGTGTIVSGNFSTINWANGPYFIKTEVDPLGGANYTINDESELLNVPYAFYSLNGPSNTIPDGTALGQMLYWNSTTWVSINPGTQNMTLTYCDNIPTWTTTGRCSITNPSVNTLNHDFSLGTLRAALVNGEVISDGNSPITERGFCWSFNYTLPSISNSNKVLCGMDTGSFFGTIAPTQLNIKVYYRAFATNQSGTSYGEVRSFTPQP